MPYQGDISVERRGGTCKCHFARNTTGPLKNVRCGTGCSNLKFKIQRGRGRESTTLRVKPFPNATQLATAPGGIVETAYNTNQLWKTKIWKATNTWSTPCLWLLKANCVKQIQLCETKCAEAFEIFQTNTNICRCHTCIIHNTVARGVRSTLQNKSTSNHKQNTNLKRISLLSLMLLIRKLHRRAFSHWKHETLHIKLGLNALTDLLVDYVSSMIRKMQYN